MRKRLAAGLVFVLLLSLMAMSASASRSISITVVFKSETLPDDAAAIVQRAGATVVAAMPELGAMVVTGPTSAMTRLNSHKAIQAASPSLEVKLAPAQAYWDAALETPPDTGAADLYNAYQWDIKQVTRDGASWALSTGSHNTVVGIIDTGVSQHHPALASNLLGGRNFTPDGPGGTVDSDDIEDRNGHGSHVAGAIAGKGRILGIGPDLGFRAYRVFSAEGGSPTSRIVQAMVAAVHDGVDVISMSLSGFDAITPYTWTDPDTGDVYRGQDVADMLLYKRAVRYAVNNGVVVVAAAGNQALNISHPPTMTAYMNAEYGSLGYSFHGATFKVPGWLPGVVTVSATGPDRSPASYSNFGPGAIEVAAPGGDFQRYPVGDWFTDMNLGAYMGTGYAFMAGTSMATPKVSAVAALMIDQAKAQGMRLTPAQVVARLQQSAVDEGPTGADPFYGHGMLDAYTALGGE